MHDARAASGHGVTFSLGGDVVDLAETPYGGPTEGIGVVAAAIVLLIAFGSLLAMGLPIVTALLGIGAGLSLIALLGHVVPRAVVLPDHRRHDRPRGRRGLRAVHRHQVPRRRCGPAPRREDAAVDRDAHRGPDRADRRHHRGDRDAGPAGAAPAAAERGRGRGRRHGRHDPARLADPAARAARLHRHPAGQALPGAAARVAAAGRPPPGRPAPSGRGAVGGVDPAPAGDRRRRCPPASSWPWPRPRSA